MSKSMGLNLASGLSGMLKDGHKSYEGIDEAVLRNIEATKQLATIVSTSLGPNGMNKLVVTHLNKIIVTNDCNTIVKELEVAHPAAKMVVLASKSQEEDMGDGTNLVVSFAGELMKKSEDLLKQGLHTSEIIIGYEKASQKAIEIVRSLVIKHYENSSQSETSEMLRDRDNLYKCLKTVISSKYYGYEEFLTDLIVRACLLVFPEDRSKKASISADSVRVLKLMGGNLLGSEVVKGIVLQRDSETIIKQLDNCKVTVFNCGIENSTTETKGTVLISNEDELLTYNKSEETMMENTIKSIAASGSNLLITGGSVSEMALHFMNKYKLMCIKVPSKWDLARVSRACNATALVRLGPGTPEEMGFCDSCRVKEIGGKNVVIIQQNEEVSRIATIIVRASTESLLNDVERVIDNGVNAVKSFCKQADFVPGAGATEIELSKQLQEYSSTCSGLDQYAIKKFGEAFEIIPKTLAENSGQDSTDALAALYVAHSNGDFNGGVDIENTGVLNATEKNIWDSLLIKENAIRHATDAALTILRIDQIIMSKVAGGPKPRKPDLSDA